jgi:hypothetical protein
MSPAQVSLRHADMFGIQRPDMSAFTLNVLMLMLTPMFTFVVHIGVGVRLPLPIRRYLGPEFCLIVSFLYWLRLLHLFISHHLFHITAH